MITQASQNKRKASKVAIVESIKVLREWWTADELIQMSGVNANTVYRQLRELLKTKVIIKAKDMVGGTRNKAKLFKLVSTDQLGHYISQPMTNVLTNEQKQEYRTSLRRWAEKQTEPWTVATAANECGLLIGFLEAYVRAEAMDGLYSQVGESRDRTTRTYKKLYIFDSEKRPAVENVFRAIIRVGHDEDFEHVTPRLSTHHLPGTPEKVEVMKKRIEMGESPCHPNDAVHAKACAETDGQIALGMSCRDDVRTYEGGRVMRKVIV